MFSLSVPSKTFLIGEYGALNGGPALLLATPPRFVLQSSLCLGTSCKRTGLESQGPAGQLLKNSAYNDYEFDFIDPHGGRGGFGGSSAQFVLLTAFYNWLKFQPTRAERLLNAYKEAVQTQTEIMPSGYDVISQYMGGLSFVNWKKTQYDLLDWTLPELEVILIRGPLKVRTHLHLKELTLGDTSEFEALALNAFDAIHFKKPDQFIESINEFSKVLVKSKLTIPESLAMQKIVRETAGVLAVKGCGALGADVIMAVVRMNEKDKVMNEFKAHKLEIVSTMSDRCAGLKVDEMSHGELQSKLEAEINFYKEDIVPDAHLDS